MRQSLRQEAQGLGLGGVVEVWRAGGREGAHLDVGDGRVEGAGPVDKAGAAVNDSLLVEPYKGLRHSC